MKNVPLPMFLSGIIIAADKSQWQKMIHVYTRAIHVLYTCYTRAISDTRGILVLKKHHVYRSITENVYTLYITEHLRADLLVSLSDPN